MIKINKKLIILLSIIILASPASSAPSSDYAVGPGVGIQNNNSSNIIYGGNLNSGTSGPNTSNANIINSNNATTNNSSNNTSTYTTDELIGIFYPGATRLMKEEIEDGVYLHDGIKFKKGKSLGEFMLSGYCNCTKCSSGIGITYSGKPTRVNHTVGAKLKNIPLNTYLIVENTHGKNVLSYDGVYQVEDTGGGARDNHLDIFQFTHDLAALVTYHGRTYADVYLAEIIDDTNSSNETK